MLYIIHKGNKMIYNEKDIGTFLAGRADCSTVEKCKSVYLGAEQRVVEAIRFIAVSKHYSLSLGRTPKGNTSTSKKSVAGAVVSTRLAFDISIAELNEALEFNKEFIQWYFFEREVA